MRVVALALRQHRQVAQQCNLAFALLHALGKRQRNGLAGVHERLPAEVVSWRVNNSSASKPTARPVATCSAKQQGQARSRGAASGTWRKAGAWNREMQDAECLHSVSEPRAPHELQRAPAPGQTRMPLLCAGACKQPQPC